LAVRVHRGVVGQHVTARVTVADGGRGGDHDGVGVADEEVRRDDVLWRRAGEDVKVLALGSAGQALEPRASGGLPGERREGHDRDMPVAGPLRGEVIAGKQLKFVKNSP
jgi:hypothetical protein